MKYALIGDLHSSTEDTLAVLNHIKSINTPLQIIALGDLFECTISQKKAKKLFTVPLEEAMEVSPAFTELLTFPSVIGNQELRIMTTTGQALFQHLPEKIQIEGATLIHGHQFTWLDDVTPRHKKYKNNIVFFGHSHHSAIFHKKKSLKFKFGHELILKKKRYSINVGSVVYHREWCLYDADVRSITFMKA